jgi:hypothetical protein
MKLGWIGNGKRVSHTIYEVTKRRKLKWNYSIHFEENDF